MTVPLSWILLCYVKLGQKHAGYFFFLVHFLSYNQPLILFIWNMITLSIFILFDIWKTIEIRMGRVSQGKFDL